MLTCAKALRRLKGIWHPDVQNSSHFRLRICWTWRRGSFRILVACELWRGRWSKSSWCDWRGCIELWLCFCPLFACDSETGSWSHAAFFFETWRMSCLIESKYKSCRLSEGECVLGRVTTWNCFGLVAARRSSNSCPPSMLVQVDWLCLKENLSCEC